MAKKSHEAAHNEDIARQRQRQPYDYGGNPLAHIHSTDSARLPAFGGAAQPGLYKPPDTKIANPAPLGLSGFALTTFLLSCVNLGVRGLSAPTIVIAPALAYGGFIQLLAGMWEIAVGEFLLPCGSLVLRLCGCSVLANPLPLSQAMSSVAPHLAHTEASGWAWLSS